VRTLPRFEDRIDLLGVGHLLAVEDAAAARDRSPASPRPQQCVISSRSGLDLQIDQRVLGAHRALSSSAFLAACHYFLGNADQRPVGRSLPRSFALTLPRRHPLYLVHAPMRGARAIAKTRDAPQPQRLGKPTEERSEDRTTSTASVIGRMMNVGSTTVVDPQLAASSKPSFTAPRTTRR